MEKYRLTSRVVEGEPKVSCSRDVSSSDQEWPTGCIGIQSTSSTSTSTLAMGAAILPPGYVRVRKSGKMANYVAYASNVLRAAHRAVHASSSDVAPTVPCRVVILGAGPAINMAISIAEILKRIFANEFARDASAYSHRDNGGRSTHPSHSFLHQLNKISMQSSALVYTPLEEGLDSVHVNKNEPLIEIRLAWTKDDLITVDGSLISNQTAQLIGPAGEVTLNGYQPPGCTAGCEWLQ